MVKPLGEPREFQNPDDPTSQITEYIRLSHSIDELDKRKKELRDTLLGYIDADGYEDHNGNILYELSSPIDGVVRLEKQRRASRKLDEQAAEEIIEEAGIADQVYEMVRVINEDALMAAFYEGKLTEEQLDTMFPTNVVWALRIPKK